MIDAAFDSLVNQRLNLVLSSDRPLAVQHSALRLLRRLHDTPTVRVAADAPLDPTELIEHVNRIVAGLSIREATDTTTGVERLAVLPVRVNAERAPDSIQLLVRLCRALPGSGLRLILIIEHPPALHACLTALGTAAFHWDIRPAAAADDGSAPPSDDTPSRTQRAAPPADAEETREPAPSRGADIPAAAAHVAPPPITPPTASGSIPGVLARIIDSASNHPLRFALWVVGVPGLVIAAALAIGSALQPARAPASAGAAQTGAPSASPPRSAVAKPANGTPKSEEASPGKAAPATTPAPSSSVATPAAKPPGQPPAAAAPAQGPPPAQAAMPATTASATAPAKPAAVPPTAASAPSPVATPPATSATTPAAPSVATSPSPPPVTAPAPPPSTAPAAPPLTPSATAQVAAPGATPAATAFECTQATVPVPQVQPRNPSKDGGMVYLTSGKSVIVCVTDGTGALTRAEITPDQSRSFFGRAPWQVQASSLRDLQVFFQGARIPLPRNATDRLELIEQRLN